MQHLLTPVLSKLPFETDVFPLELDEEIIY